MFFENSLTNVSPIGISDKLFGETKLGYDLFGNGTGTDFCPEVGI